MCINSEIIMAHKNLSTSSFRFLRFIEKNPEALKRSDFNILDGIEEVGKLQPWPIFINQHTKNKLKEAGVRVFNLIKGIPQRIFANNPYKMSSFYEIPADIVKMQLDGANDRHIEGLLARGDFILTAAGLRCLEFNVSANIGGMQVAYWEPMYANIPIISKFLKENRLNIQNKNLLSILIEHIFDKAVDRFPDETAKINIAMAIPGYREGVDRLMENDHLNRIYKNILQLKANHLQGKIIFCDYPLLDINDNYLFYKGKKIHALIEMYLGVVPPRILQVFKSGNVCLYNGPAAKLLSNKLNLALLSQYQDSDIFNPDEKEIIRTYIPWTRKLVPGDVTYKASKVKLEEFIFVNKEQLVIKPPLGISGANICIGKNTPEQQWEKMIKRAFREKNWVIQEYAKSYSYLFQKGEYGCAEHIATWGIFVFGSHFGGLWVRVLPTENKNGVINSIQGAEESVVLELEEQNGEEGGSL